jgi:hypothetical protein
LRRALFGYYHAYYSGGFTISTVAMDGESTAINIADMINGPWFQALAFRSALCDNTKHAFTRF